MKLVIHFLLIMLYAAACAPKPSPAPVTPDCTLEELTALKSEMSTLQQTLLEQERQQQVLENNISGLQMKVLEKDALVNELERHNDAQQKRFDEAIVEVVRAKAKLRSLESKAEAASTIAETEIAVKALKNRVPAEKESMAEITKAEKLLEMSSNEFKRENFGGALYLASQAKTQIRMGHLLLGAGKEIDIIEGEVLFIQPLPLKVIKNSNLRAGPDLDQKILTQLQEGALVVGYSYKGNWVRIQTKKHEGGWIFQSLVSAR